MQKLRNRTGILLCCLCLSGYGLALAEERSDAAQGPGTVALRSVRDAETPSRPAYFPHQKHQWLECVTCHHSTDKEGALVAPVSGEEVVSCENCHNSADADALSWKRGTFKRVGHYFCMECHLKNAKQAARCGVCHVQKQ